MGKPRMDLLKGIEEQENAIESSKAYQEAKPLNERQQKVIEMLNSGMSQKEIADSFGVDKSAICRDVKFIRENYPDKLTAQTKTPTQDTEHKDGYEHLTATIEKSEKQEPQYMTLKVTEAPQEAPKQFELHKSTPAEEKAEERANTKPQKQSFSFRADQSKIESWKLYAETIGTKDIGTLWTAAIDEYISNHALTADQQAIYDLKKKAAEMAKKQNKL